MKKEDLKVIIGEGADALTEEQAQFISEKIQTIVDTKVEAEVQLKTEIVEAESKEKYNTLLEEKTKEYETTVSELQESLTTKAEEFKTKLEEKTTATIESYKEEKDEEVETFKESMVTKLDEYLDLELSKAIPDTHVEALAKVAVLEPIVNGFKSVMEENYIKFDEDSFGLLKDARAEILNLRGQLSESVNESIDLNKKVNEIERQVKISKVCEGLSDVQRERATKLLESYDADEIEGRFNMIKEIVLSEGSSSESDDDTEFVAESDSDTSDVSKTITEDVDTDETEELEESVNPYAEYAEDYKRLIGKK